jgi:hypothetical protein
MAIAPESRRGETEHSGATRGAGMTTFSKVALIVLAVVVVMVALLVLFLLPVNVEVTTDVGKITRY